MGVTVGPVLGGDPAMPVMDTLAWMELTDYKWNKTSPPSSLVIWALLVEYILDWAAVA